MSVILAALIAVFPAAFAMWSGRQILALSDHSTVPERLLSNRTRNGFVTGLCGAVLGAIAFRHLPWALSLLVLTRMGASYSFRKQLHRRELGLRKLLLVLRATHVCGLRFLAAPGDDAVVRVEGGTEPLGGGRRVRDRPSRVERRIRHRLSRSSSRAAGGRSGNRRALRGDARPVQRTSLRQPGAGRSAWRSVRQRGGSAVDLAAGRAGEQHARGSPGSRRSRRHRRSRARAPRVLQRSPSLVAEPSGLRAHRRRHGDGAGRQGGGSKRQHGGVRLVARGAARFDGSARAAPAGARNHERSSRDRAGRRRRRPDSRVDQAARAGPAATPLGQRARAPRQPSEPRPQDSGDPRCQRNGAGLAGRSRRLPGGGRLVVRHVLRRPAGLARRSVH